MKNSVLAIGMWLAAAGVAMGQSSRPAAEACDCTGTCAPSSATTSGGTQIVQAGAFDFPAAEFQNALNVVLPLKGGAAPPSLSDKVLRFSSVMNGAPQLLDANGRLVGEIDETLLRDRIANSPAIDKLSARIFLGRPSPQWVIDPILKKGDFLPPTTQRGQALCRAAIQTSTSPAAKACSEAVAKLCPRGTDAPSCSIYELQARVASGDPGTLGAILKYDNACLRSDTPGAGGSKFDFQTITARSGVLKINVANARSTCSIVAQAVPAADKVFCSAVAIEPDKVVTARHCFVSKQNTWLDISACIPQGAVEFSTLLDPGKSHVIADVRDAIEAIKRTKVGDDYVVLGLKAPIAGISGPVKQAVPAPFEEVAIFSYHNLVSPADPATLPAWRRKARWSLPACTFTQVADACALTKCQTIEMYSGAPVWMLDDAGVTNLAGIQAQGGGAGLSACNSQAPASALSVFDTNLSIRGYANE